MQQPDTDTRDLPFQVAVKQMRKDAAGFAESELVNAALHEMIMGSKFQEHPHIVSFVGAAIHPCHGILLVYELIDGINLEDFFHFQRSKSKSWRPKLKHSLRWGRHIFLALAALHSADTAIMHRDVKPSNLMLCRGTADGKEYFDVSSRALLKLNPKP